MYATQNLSEVALRYLSEVNQELPSDYKAAFIEAREHYKLGEHEIAQELIKRASNCLLNWELKVIFITLIF